MNLKKEILLIHEYEQKQYFATHMKVQNIYGVKVFKVLLEELDIKQKDLIPVIKTELIVFDVLNGKRKLTVEHIQKLGDFSMFHMLYS